MIDTNILKENVRLLLISKGWKRDRLMMYMGWGSSATYCRKFKNGAMWSLDEINRLLIWAGKSFEEVFVNRLI